MTDAVVLKNINYEYDKFVSTIQRALQRPSRFVDLIATKSFAKEKKIQVRSKLFRVLNFSYLLKFVIFGDDLNKLRYDEMTHKTNKCVVIYLDSKERIEELFEINNRNAFLQEIKMTNPKFMGVQVELYFSGMMTMIDCNTLDT